MHLSSTAPPACPECGGSIDTDSPEPYCIDCGLVVSEPSVDHGPERYTSHDGSESPRYGAPRTNSIHDSDIGSAFPDVDDWDSSTVRKRKELQRKQLEHRKARVSGNDTTVIRGLYEIDRLCGTLSLEDQLQEAASYFYRQLVEDGFLQPRSIEAVTTAVVYCACRQAGVIRRVGELEQYSQVDANTIWRTARDLQQGYDLPLPPRDIAEHVPRLTSGLDLPPKVTKRAQQACDEWVATDSLPDRSPSVVAATVVYLISRQIDGVQTPTQKDISRIAGVNPTSIRRAKNDIDNEGADLFA